MDLFNPLDYVLLVLLVIFVFTGYRRGFLAQVLSIASVIVSFLVAARYHQPLAEMSFFDAVRTRSETSALVISFVGIFLVATTALGLISSKLGKKLREKEIHKYDKTFGAVLGCCKGVLLLGGLALGVAQYGLPDGAIVKPELREKGEGLIADSYLIPKLTEGCLVLIELIPVSGREEISHQYKTQIAHLSGEEAPEREKTTSLNPGTETPIVEKQTASDEPTRTRKTPDRGIPDLGALRRLVYEESEKTEPAPTSSKSEAPISDGGQLEGDANQRLEDAEGK